MIISSLTQTVFVMSQNGSTALILAANGGHVHAVRLLINNGADVNFVNNVRVCLENVIISCDTTTYKSYHIVSYDIVPVHTNYLTDRKVPNFKSIQFSEIPSSGQR